MQVQFKTGRTEGLITTITVREHWQHLPQFSAKWSERPNLYIHYFRKRKKAMKNNHFGVNKARYPPLGGMDSSPLLNSHNSKEDSSSK